jgi:hypothetical protein
MCDNLPDLEDEYTDSGNKLHEAMETGDITELTEEEQELVIKAKEREEAFLESVDGIEYKEKTLNTIYKYKILNFGTCDKIIITPNNLAYLIDYKFGYYKVKKDSLQILNYAIAVYQNYLVNKVVCLVNQPTINNYPIIAFESGDLKEGLEYIASIIEKAKNSYELNPGEYQCRFCKAKSVCPAYQKKFNQLQVVENTLPEMSDENVINLYQQWEMIKKYGKEIETELKKRASSASGCGKYYIKEVPGNRKIKDIQGYVNCVSDYCTPQEIVNNCEISISKAEKLVTDKLKASGMKAKDAKIKFSELCESVITRGENKNKLERKE